MTLRGRFRRSGPGITPIEVLLGVVVLALLASGLAAAATGLARIAGESEQRAAVRFVNNRIQLVQMYSDYATLERAFAGARSDLPGLPGAVMETQIDPLSDATRVTVTISGGALPQPVARSIVIARTKPPGSVSSPVTLSVPPR